MSVDVPIHELRRRVIEAGPVAFLVTVDESSEPHLVSVGVDWAADELCAQVGRSSAANASHRSAVTLLWAVAADGYSLIVDGTATVSGDDDAGGAVRVTPTRAVLHRLADVPADDDRPSCVRILPG